MSKPSVLFLCTGNSCRSQMAEGMVNHFLQESWTAHSAGTQPAGYVHPLAVTVLDELGVDITNGRSKSVDEFRDAVFDAVITVCDDAAETCPIWLGQGRVVHIGFPDPAKATGSDAEKLAVFRSVRDAIRSRVLEYLSEENPGGAGIS
jgi:arsenate reductase